MRPEEGSREEASLREKRESLHTALRRFSNCEMFQRLRRWWKMSTYLQAG